MYDYKCALLCVNVIAQTPAREIATKEEEEEEEEEEQEQQQDDEDAESGHLVVRVRPFVSRQDMPSEIKNKRRASDDDLPSVWEVTTEHEDVTVDGLIGPCMVLPVGSNAGGNEATAGGMPTFWGEGFVATTSDQRRFEVVRQTWRRSGHHGGFHDRRSRAAHDNVDGLPVFSTGFVCSSDGFNYTSGSKQYSVRATYLAPSCLSPALLRRLRSWWLVTVGRRARWEQEMRPLTAILRMLENGCRARIRRGNAEAETVSRTRE